MTIDLSIRSTAKKTLCAAAILIVLQSLCGCVSPYLPRVAAEGDSQTAIALIEQGEPVDEKYFGRQALHYAAREKHADVVRALIDAGADVNTVTDEEHYAPIHYSSRNGDLETTRILVAANANIDMFNGEKETPLVLSILSGNEAIVRLLLEAGAEVNKGESISIPPLAAAAASNDPEMIKLLLGHGANLEGLDKVLNTPLCVAALRNNTDASNALRSAGANQRHRNVFRQGIAHFAAYHGNVETLQLFAQSNIDLASASVSGRTPYHFSVMTNQKDAIDFLLSYGAKPNPIDLTLVDREVSAHAFARYGDYLGRGGDVRQSVEAYQSAALWYQKASEEYGREAKNLSIGIWGAFVGDILSAAVAGAVQGAMASSNSRTVLTNSGEIYRITPITPVPYQVTDTGDFSDLRAAYREKETELGQLASKYAQRTKK